MKKILISLFIISFFLFVFFFFDGTIYATSRIIGYTIDSNREEGVLYESDRHLPTKSYTASNFDNFKNVTDLNNNRDVIGEDGRSQVYNWQYIMAPYRSVCRIEVQYNEEGALHKGTGFLVGPHTILTACHVVYDTSTEHNYGWFDTIFIEFGTYVSTVTGLQFYPYGTITTYSSATCGSYRDTHEFDDDWALIELTTDIGNDLGFFGVTSTLQDDDSVKVMGYAYDYYGNMCYSTGQADDVETYQFEHDCDTESGESGGPVIKTSNGYVCGIHSGSTSYWFFGEHFVNHACKVSPYIVAWIEDRQFNY